MTVPAVIVGLALMLLLGAGLLIRGLRGRRVGDEPHCRKCGYDLTGLRSETCPECGTAASGKNVVIGTRRRRRPALAIGAVLLLVSLTGVGLGIYGKAKNVNWYVYYPTYLLLGKAQDDDSLAVAELVARARNNLLTETQVSRIAPVALAKHGADPYSPNLARWADLLALIDRRQGLTREQRERFYEQYVGVEVQTRPVIRQGDPLCLWVCHDARGSSALIGPYLVEEKQLTIGGRRYRHNGLRGWGPWAPGSRMGAGQTFRVDWLGPGEHTIEYVVSKSVSPPGFDADPPPIWSQRVTLTQTIKILPRDAPHPIVLVNDPVLAEAIKNTIAFRSVTAGRRGLLRRWHVTAEVAVKGPLPVGIGFEVIALANGKEIKLGTIASARMDTSYTRSWLLPGADLWSFDADQITPILRTSREAAMETVDCFEVWNGELRFDPIPVERDP